MSSLVPLGARLQGHRLLRCATTNEKATTSSYHGLSGNYLHLYHMILDRRLRSSLLSLSCRSCESKGCAATATASRCLQKKSSRGSDNFEDSKSHHIQSPSLVAVAIAIFLVCYEGPATALEVRMEPANALSLPTWAVHVSSVLEWVTAMVLFWRLAEASGNERWKGMTWGMMPLLGGALSACTYHFFYNSPDLDFLVVLQAALTVVGNFTLWLAAYRLFTGAQKAT
eukprot:jgi/Botrbrau1/20110/Bobra.0173s0013.1